MFKNFASLNEHHRAMELAENPPFSFTYGGKPFPEGFTQTGKHEYLHAETGLKVTLAVETYGEDSSAVEWTPYFENTGSADSLIIEKICPVYITVPVKAGAWLGKLSGPHGKATDFSYTEEPIAHNDVESNGSRDYVPFFNLANGADSGFVLALGWTGGWKLNCALTEDGKEVTVRAGMKETHFLLHPGEKVRQPRVMILFWEGDKLRGQNMCRRHLTIHHIPKDESGEPYPPVCAMGWGGTRASSHIRYLDYIKEHNLRFDYYWIDAGWYGPDHVTEEFQNFYDEDWAYHHGDWSVNMTTYPNGMKEVSDAAKEAGMKLLLWFGTYRVNEGMGWYNDHPEWAAYMPEKPHGIGLNPKLTRLGTVNISIPEARRYLMETIGKTMKDNDVRGYREDTAIPQAGEDTPDRIGISEIISVTSLYEIWDYFRELIPDLLIDNCGGGGSRIDLETISRSYVLWRSDYNCHPGADPLGSQSGNWGLGHFVPLVNGAAPVNPGSTYTFRSSLYGGMPFGLFHPCGYGSAPCYPADGYPVEWHKRMLDQWQDTKKLLCGDFYPLTDCDIETNSFCAYAFDRPDLGKGCLLAFFRQDFAEDTVTLKLNFPAGEYLFTDYDSGEQRKVTIGCDGAEFTVTAAEMPYAAAWYFERV